MALTSLSLLNGISFLNGKPYGFSEGNGQQSLNTNASPTNTLTVTCCHSTYFSALYSPHRLPFSKCKTSSNDRKASALRLPETMTICTMPDKTGPRNIPHIHHKLGRTHRAACPEKLLVINGWWRKGQTFLCMAWPLVNWPCSYKQTITCAML